MGYVAKWRDAAHVAIYLGRVTCLESRDGLKADLLRIFRANVRASSRPDGHPSLASPRFSAPVISAALTSWPPFVFKVILLRFTTQPSTYSNLELVEFFASFLLRYRSAVV